MHPSSSVCIFILCCFASCMAVSLNTLDGQFGHIGLQPQQDSSNTPERIGRSQLAQILFYKLSSKSQNNVIHPQKHPNNAPAPAPGAADPNNQAKSRRDETENNLQASVGTNPPLGRKPGCRVFYWKSYTAC